MGATPGRTTTRKGAAAPVPAAPRRGFFSGVRNFFTRKNPSAADSTIVSREEEAAAKASLGGLEARIAANRAARARENQRTPLLSAAALANSSA